MVPTGEGRTYGPVLAEVGLLSKGLLALEEEGTDIRRGQRDDRIAGTLKRVSGHEHGQ